MSGGADLLFQRAFALHRAGDLAAAARLYDQALAARPRHAAALHYRGLLAYQQGDWRRAADLIGRSVRIEGKDPAAWNNLGNALQKAGRPAEAVKALETALGLAPGDARAAFNLGNALDAAGRFDAAERQYRAAIAARPDHAPSHLNLGTVLGKAGRWPEAEEALHRAIDLDPTSAPAQVALGELLRHLGRGGEAEAAFRRAVELDPLNAEAQGGLGVVLEDKGAAVAAEGCYRAAIGLDPSAAAPHARLALLLLHSRRSAEAVTLAQAAVALEPGNAGFHVIFGAARETEGEVAAAMAAYETALALDPDQVAAFTALRSLRRTACDWRAFDADEARLLELSRRDGAVAPLELLSAPSSPADQLWAGQRLAGSLATAPAFVHPKPGPVERLRIGYLSGDFRYHAVASLVAEIFERHDRSYFETIGYSLGPDDGSAIRRRIAAGLDRFVDLRDRGHAEVAARIHADGIHILVDLGGYTKYARPAAVALRPAPLQVSWLGFPGTMGADFIDYLLADRFLIPPEAFPFHTEKVVWLPECYQPGDNRRPVAPAPARADCGLSDGAFVFASFNNAAKLTPAIFTIWMRLLVAVPGAVLWLSATIKPTADNLRREAAARGIDPARLVFAPPMPPERYLACLGLADLFLDSAPYNAGATANDCLWAGLPLVTLAGDTYVGRMAGSLLTAAGLPELIAHAPEEYEALALALAGDPARLGRMRAHLARRQGGLFDAGRFTQGLEAAYRRMWEVHRAGSPPEAFAVGGAAAFHP